MFYNHQCIAIQLYVYVYAASFHSADRLVCFELITGTVLFCLIVAVTRYGSTPHLLVRRDWMQLNTNWEDPHSSIRIVSYASVKQFMGSILPRRFDL